jgi:hypothetical protein
VQNRAKWSQILPSGFPYDRAALVLAEASLFGDTVARDKWKVPKRTFYHWRARLDTDAKLDQLYQKERTNLLSNWQGDTIRVMKAALTKLEVNIHALKEDGDPKVIYALAAVAKTIGELAITNTVLGDDSGDDMGAS